LEGPLRKNLAELISEHARPQERKDGRLHPEHIEVLISLPLKYSIVFEATKEKT
jgi:hypothetical protein